MSGKRRAFLTVRSIKEDNVLSHIQDAVHGRTVARTGAFMTGDATPLASDVLVQLIQTSLEDSKAEEIVKIDLRGKSEMADWMIIATGRSTRQVASIADRLVDTMKQDHGRLSKVEGKDTGDWVLIDLGDAIVHVFRPEVREFYQLEKMWLNPGEASASKS